MSVLILRPANADDCSAISDLCMRSKAMWGYDAPFMDACRVELTFTEETLARSEVQIAEIDGRIIGMVEVTATGNAAQLEKLFIDPAAMRCGAGRELFNWARDAAVALGATVLTIESDPQAADFYRCMGAIDDGTVASTSIPDRFIPKLTLQLQKTN